MAITYSTGNVVALGEVTVEQHGIDHIPKFTGHIWFVTNDGDDDNAGISPHTAFATIGAAVAAASAGDAITIKAGTYVEDVDVDLAGLELWAEINATIAGTLTVSADACRVQGFIIAPTAAVGLALTGNRCAIEDIKVVNQPTIAFDIDGYQNIVQDCKAVGYTISAYDVANYNVLLYRCIAQGADAATRGFCFSDPAADGGTLEECISIGNATSGYEFVTGTANNTVIRCSSGSGDGRWVDADNANVWSDFTFDDRVYHTTTFDNSGPASDNLFRVYGLVIVTEFSGEVETVLAADIGNGYIELWDGTNTIDVTDSPGPAFNSLPVLSFLIDDNTVQIAIEDSSQVSLYEDATKFGEDPNFQITAKAATATYIRLTYSGAGASGAIHWHCQWRSLSEDGWVETA